MHSIARRIAFRILHRWGVEKLHSFVLIQTLSKLFSGLIGPVSYLCTAELPKYNFPGKVSTCAQSPIDAHADTDTVKDTEPDTGTHVEEETELQDGCILHLTAPSPCSSQSSCSADQGSNPPRPQRRHFWSSRAPLFRQHYLM